ncbi:MAG: ankyrin repeat domain-containing protein [Chlamydiota bacterium]
MQPSSRVYDQQPPSYTPHNNSYHEEVPPSEQPRWRGRRVSFSRARETPINVEEHIPHSATPQNPQLHPRVVTFDSSTQTDLPYTDKETEDFVESFNRGACNTRDAIEEAQARLKSIKQDLWTTNDNGNYILNVDQVQQGRAKLYTLSGCNHYELSKEALEALILVLECDPIQENTAQGLIALQKRIAEDSKAVLSQEDTITLQRLRIRAYATTLISILLHSTEKHLNAISEATKQEILTATKELQALNSSEDPEIAFWTKFSYEATITLKSEHSSSEEWLKRTATMASFIMNITSSGAQIAGAAATPTVGGVLSLPSSISGNLTAAYNDLSSAISSVHLEKQWLKPVLTIIYMAYFSALNGKEFTAFLQKVTEYKHSPQHTGGSSELFFSIIFALEHIVIHSPKPKIRQDALRTLIQYIRMDSPEIQVKIINTLDKIMRCSRDHKITNTSLMILSMIHHSKSLSTIEGRETLSALPQLKRPQDYIRDALRQRCNIIPHDQIYPPLIHTFLVNVAEIKVSLRHPSFSTLLAYSDEYPEKIAGLLEGMIQTYENAFVPDNQSNNFFHSCASQGKADLIKYIHQRIGDNRGLLNAKNKEGDTPAHEAFKAPQNYLATLETLLSSGADPSIYNERGENLAHIAAQSAARTNDTDAIALLAEYNADFHRPDKTGTSALDYIHRISTDITLDQIEQSLQYQFTSRLLERLYDLPRTSHSFFTPDYNTLTHIMLSIKNGAELYLGLALSKQLLQGNPLTLEEEIELIKFIVPCPNAAGHTTGCSTEFIRLCNMLNVNLRPIFEKFNISEPIISADSDEIAFTSLRTTEESFPFNNSRLIQSIAEGHCPQNPELITQDIGRRNILGYSALHAAVITSNTDAVETLLNNNIDVDHQDYQGNTALHYAVYLGNQDVVELLLEAGANKSIMNRYKETPLMVACGVSPTHFYRINTSLSFNHTDNPQPHRQSNIIGILNLLLGISLSRSLPDLPPPAYPTPNSFPIEVESSPNTDQSESEMETLYTPSESFSEDTASTPSSLNSSAIGSTDCERGSSLSHLSLHFSETPLVERDLHKDSFGNNLLHHALKYGFQQVETLEDMQRMIQLLLQYNRELFFAPNNGGAVPLRSLLESANPDPELLEYLITVICQNSSFEDVSRRMINDGVPLPLIFARSDVGKGYLQQIFQDEEVAAFKGDKGDTALHIAADNRDITILNDYREHGRNNEWPLLNQQDDDGLTPAHRTILAGDITFPSDQDAPTTFIQELVSAGCDLTITDNEGYTPALLAIKQQHPGLTHFFHGLSQLQVNNEEFNVGELFGRNNAGDLPIHIACRAGFDDIIPEVIENFPQTLYKVNNNLQNPLHVACEHGNLKAVEMLLEARKRTREQRPLENDVHSLLEATDITGATPLVTAAQNGHHEIVKLLLETGVNFLAPDHNLEIALHKACFQRHANVVKELLEYESRFIDLPEDKKQANVSDINLETALLELGKWKSDASLEVEKRIISLLLQHGANPSQRGEKGETLLHNLAEQGREELLKYFIEESKAHKKPVSINTRDHLQELPLHKACRNNHLQCATILALHKKTQINSINNDQMTPIQLAARTGNLDLVAMLFEKIKSSLCSPIAIQRKNTSPIDIPKGLIKEFREALIGVPINSQQNFHHINNWNLLLLMLNHEEALEEQHVALIVKIAKAFPRLLMQKDEEDNNILHIIAKNGHTAVLKALMDNIPRTKELLNQPNKKNIYPWESSKNDDIHHAVRSYTMRAPSPAQV